MDSAGFAAALGAANRLNEGVSLASAWGFETILTCLLVFTVFAATDAQRATKTSHLPVGNFYLHEKYAAHVREESASLNPVMRGSLIWF